MAMAVEAHRFQVEAQQFEALKSYLDVDMTRLPEEWVSVLKRASDQSTLLQACWRIGYHGMRLINARVRAVALTPQAHALLKTLNAVLLETSH